MLTSFGNDDRDVGNKNTNPANIVSIHLADCGDDCSNQDNDGSVVSVVSFESTANDWKTNDNDDLPGANAPAVRSELENDNSNENVVTNDDDGGDDDDSNEAEDMSGDNKDDDSKGNDSVSNNDTIIPQLTLSTEILPGCRY